MSNDLLREQHKNIRREILEIEQGISNGNIDNQAFDLALKIGKLSGTLVLHLKSEDNYLYPHLKSSKDEALRKTAEQLNLEMGSLAAEFMKYKGTYMSAPKIKANNQEFIEDTKKIITALKNRLDQEDLRIYKHV